MTYEHVRQAFLNQARACDALGSPFTARLCRLLAERLQPDGLVANRLLNWTGDPSSKADSVPLRIAGCLHALVLEGRDALLATTYPPSAADDDSFWAIIRHAFDAHAGFILERLKSPPQTNEVRRSAVLLPGFLTIADLIGKPLVLSEVGASAGLNLQWDRYRYALGERSWGDPSSLVSIAPDWHGNPPPTGNVIVNDRAACDLNPLDAANPDDRMRLISYIWADQSDRIARTRAALTLATSNNLHVEKADAIDWLKTRLAGTLPGATHVLYHTIAWQYLPEALRAEGEQLITEAGNRATEAAPFARLSLEADESHEGASLTLQVWPSAEKQQIGRADFHGRWVNWRGWEA
jgi:hypothetical protein